MYTVSPYPCIWSAYMARFEAPANCRRCSFYGSPGYIIVVQPCIGSGTCHYSSTLPSMNWFRGATCMPITARVKYARSIPCRSGSVTVAMRYPRVARSKPSISSISFKGELMIWNSMNAYPDGFLGAGQRVSGGFPYNYRSNFLS